MTEPVPSDYDLYVQDPRIDGLEEIVTPSYTPPQDVEYSFPVTGQGISADQYRLMNLGQANGIIHGDNGVVNDSPNSTGYRYYLEGHATDAETNQRNTLMLRAGTSAEAIMEGFYHRLTQDMELSFPPVTTPTTYYVCLTFDPLEEDNPAGPISVQVYSSSPPTSNRRVHLILHTVQRRANQLLSQATVTRYRPYTAGIVAVQNANQLPDVDSYPAGTLAVPSSTEATGIYVRSNTSPKRWINTLKDNWTALTMANGFTSRPNEPARCRVTPYGLQLKGGVGAANATSMSHRVTTLPQAPLHTYRTTVPSSANDYTLQVNTEGVLSFSGSNFQPTWISLDNVFIPLD